MFGVHYHARRDTILLDKINVIIAPETRLAIVGPNGVGKSYKW